MSNKTETRDTTVNNLSDVTTELSKPLDRANVKQRVQGGSSVSYIEGWHAIKEANTIFGFLDWQRETVYLNEVCRYEYNGKNKVGFEAKVRITVNGVSREGTGYGSGIAKDLYDAIESAGKEAETDGMKRAFMTFGNRFGLALYDKAQREVEDVEGNKKKNEEEEAERERVKQSAIRAKAEEQYFVEYPIDEKWVDYSDSLLQLLRLIKTADEYALWRSANLKGFQFLAEGDKKLSDQLTVIAKAKKAELGGGK